MIDVVEGSMTSFPPLMSPSLGSSIYQLSRDCKTITHLKQILAKIIISGTADHGSSLSALIAFSAAAPPRDEPRIASSIFALLDEPSSFACNSLLRGLLNIGCPHSALLFFVGMDRGGSTPPDKFTFPLILKACALLLAKRTGKSVHGRIWVMGFSFDAYVQSGLIRMYSDFSEISEARKLFDLVVQKDSVLWNSMIGGYLKCGLLNVAVQMFEEMPCKTAGAYNTMAGGFVKFGNLHHAWNLFEQMPERDAISWNTMIGAYARAGCSNTALQLFDLAPERNLTTWSAIISGFAQSSQFEKALEMFNRMLAEEVKPNQALLASVLSSCTHLGALEQGMWVHGYIKNRQFIVDDLLGAALIDMYSKCGLLERANIVFQKMERKGVRSWNSLIHGFAIHGYPHKALDVFGEMEKFGVKPNEITFVSILSACSHAGLVQQGYKIFNQIQQIYDLSPTIEHYTCMVDILSRANLLEEAQELIKSMPMEPDVVVWGALHGGCRLHWRQGLLGSYLGLELANLKPDDSGVYVLASNICVLSDQWEEAAKLRSMMAGLGVKKNAGCSLIEVDHVVHEFLACGRLHSKSTEVYEMLHKIYSEMNIQVVVLL